MGGYSPPWVWRFRSDPVSQVDGSPLFRGAFWWGGCDHSFVPIVARLRFICAERAAKRGGENDEVPMRAHIGCACHDGGGTT